MVRASAAHSAGGAPSAFMDVAAAELGAHLRGGAVVAALYALA